MASSVKVSVRTCSSATPWPMRQAYQPKVTHTAALAISSTRSSIVPSSSRSLRGTGARRISSPAGGSITRFTVSVPSVTMLIHRICTATSGSGRPASSASISTTTSSIEVANRYRISFFRLP